MDMTTGMIWQKELTSPPSTGIEVHSDSLFFADSSGTLYSCWTVTGQLNWKRTLKNENIVMIFPLDAGLGVIASRDPSPFSTYRIYSYDTGIITFETNLELKPRDTYASDGNGVIVHSADAVLMIGEGGRKITLYDLSAYSRKIVTFAKWDNYYYLIDGSSRIFRFDNDMMPSGQSFTLGGIFSGNAVYYENRIYISSSAGLKIVDTAPWSVESSENGFKDESLPPVIVFTGTAGLFNNRISSKTNYYIYSDLSFKSIDENYSPFILSESLGVASFIDSKGYLEIIDRSTGRYIHSRFIGSVDRPFLKIARDYQSKSIFIPMSSPAKIFCYSLNFAVSQKMPR
jgi:hypothetical protein